MLDSTGYLIAWAVYMGATAVLLILWWRLTRRRKGLLQILLRLLPAAWVLVPIPSAIHDNWWLPALIVATLGTIADGWDVGARGVAALIVASIVALVVSLLGWWWQRRRNGAAVAPAAATRTEPLIVSTDPG